MKCWLAVALCGWLAIASLTGADAARTSRSVSQQFIVHANTTPPRFRSPSTIVTNNPETVTLKPNLLAVTSERVKQAILRELDLTDQWRGTIQLVLRPTDVQPHPSAVLATLQSDGWVYRLELPEEIEAEALLRSLTQVILLEIANRSSTGRSAELPLWLLEALTRQLYTERSLLVLEPDTRTMGSRRPATTLEQSRTDVRKFPPLNFTELSLPSPAQLAPGPFKQYQSCAYLFFNELQQLPDGRACLREMLRLLPAYWNWQTAFHQAFGKHLPNALATEKWWAVSLANYTGRNESRTWSRALSLQKLEEVMVIPAQVHFRAGEMPSRTRQTLSQVITDWDYIQQKPILNRKIQQLTTLRMTVTGELIPLVDSYRLVLENYMQKRDRAGFSRERKGDLPIRPEMAANEAARQLAELDRQRAAIPLEDTPPISQVTRP